MVLAFISEFLVNEAIVDVKPFSLIYLRPCMALESYRSAHALALEVLLSNMFLFHDVNNIN